MIGKVLGDRYEVIEQIGEGGMSFVYKARCRKLNRFVAIKILKDIFYNNEEIVKKFKREATSIATLSNANIVNVLDVGTQDEKHYIVMEYVEGKTLKEIIIEKGRIPYEVSLSIAIKVGKALECAHKNNIIHRDVKPQNIMVTEDGIVKVTDFGIAKSMDSSTMAHTNSVLGSAHYFSPEQAKGGYIDCRTDLYSLGIVLYEMVTGVVPFDGDSPVTVAVKHIQEAPIPPKSINGTIPDSLNDLIMKAMSKDPVNRYQSSRDMITDLEKLKNNPNASITNNKSTEGDGFTRVMSPVIPTAMKETLSKDENNFDEEEYDEDEEDDDSYEEEEDDDYGNKKSKWLWALLAVGVVAIGIFAGMFAMKGLTTGGKLIAVPEIMSLSKEEAKKQIEDLGLTYVEVTEESDGTPGVVLKVDPNVGTEVKKGSIVKVTISGESTKVSIPSVTGMTVDAAKSVLDSAELTLGDITYEYSDKVANGNIIRQSPEIGDTVEKNTRVDIVVSKGKEMRVQKIPDLSGKSVNDAKTLLESLSFKINPVLGEKAPSEDLNGKIYKQDPGVGYEVKEGTTVTVTYYDDYVAPKKTYNTSEIKGMTKNAAFAWAGERNIVIVFTPSDAGSDWTVDSINTSTVEEGGTINVTLKAPPTTEPDVPTGGSSKPDKPNKPEDNTTEDKKPEDIPEGTSIESETSSEGN